MASSRKQTRQEDPVSQTEFKGESFARLNTLVKRGNLASHDITKATVHCHIPVCIGYGNGTISPEELSTLIEHIKEKGYSFTIYAAPRAKFEKESEDPYVLWKRENSVLLDSIKDNVVLESDWRKTERWMQAKAKFDAFEKNDPALIKRVLDADVQSYLKRHENAVEDEIRQHMRDCAIDCLSWMIEKPQDPKVALDCINVLCYSHDLTQLMRNMNQNAERIGYLQGSLLHIQPKYKEAIVHAHERDTTASPVQYAQTLRAESYQDGGLTQAQLDALKAISTVCLLQGVDELYLAKVATSMVLAFEQGRVSAQAAPTPTTTPTSHWGAMPKQPSVANMGVFGSSDSSRAAAAARQVASPGHKRETSPGANGLALNQSDKVDDSRSRLGLSSSGGV